MKAQTAIPPWADGAFHPDLVAGMLRDALEDMPGCQGRDDVEFLGVEQGEEPGDPVGGRVGILVEEPARVCPPAVLVKRPGRAGPAGRIRGLYVSVPAPARRGLRGYVKRSPRLDRWRAAPSLVSPPGRPLCRPPDIPSLAPLRCSYR